MSLEIILLVHEDACIRGVVRAVLQHLGYQILEASGEDEAMNLALTSNFTIDLLLADVSMELADHLKSSPISRCCVWPALRKKPQSVAGRNSVMRSFQSL